MGEIKDARAQREAMDAVAARKAAGVERRFDALRTYLAALLYEEKHSSRERRKDSQKK